MRIEWSPRALAEYEEAVRYLRRRSPSAAEDMAADVEKAEDRLLMWPRIGSPTLVEGARTLVLRKWSKLLVYMARGEEITIVSFWDTRRKPLGRIG